MDISAAATDQGPPWVAIVAAIGGAAIGGFVAFIGSWWQEQRRWAREDRLRWDPARLSAYSQFIESARLISHRGRLYWESVQRQKNLRSTERQVKELVDLEYQTIMQTRKYEYERMNLSYSDAASMFKAIRDGLEEKHQLTEIRKWQEAASEEEPRLRQEWLSANDSFTKAASEIDLIASRSTATKAADVRRHNEQLIGFLDRDISSSIDDQIDDFLTTFTTESERLLAEFRIQAEKDLTAPTATSDAPRTQIVGMARLWGTRRK